MTQNSTAAPALGQTITGTCETYGIERTGKVVEVHSPVRGSGRTSAIYRIDTGDGFQRMITWNRVLPAATR